MSRGLPKEMQFGGFLDLSTVGGTIKSIIIVLLGSFFIWNAHHVFDWVYSVLGIESVPDSESTIRIRRFWAGVAAGTMMLLGGRIYYGSVGIVSRQLRVLRGSGMTMLL